VYLRASVPTLLRRIAQRGRDFERSISSEYLTSLNDLYDEWVATFSLCPIITVETDNLDYLHHDEHLDQVVQRIEDRLYGREYLTFR
jgi:deoxyadenosine/deoxycytidine kinase